MFRPSRDSLLRQNEEIDRLELPRIQNDAELEQLIASEELGSNCCRHRRCALIRALHRIAVIAVRGPATFLTI